MFDATTSPLVLVHQLGGALLLPPLLWLWPFLAGVCMRRLGWARVGRACRIGALVGLYLSTTPFMAMWLARGLEPASPISRAELDRVDAIVVLGGGKRAAPEYGEGESVGLDTLARLRYGAWLAARSGKPVLLSGGAPFGGRAEADVMVEVLEREYRLPARWRETRSRTTLENARASAAILLPMGVRRIALVSQGWHLRRAGDFFRSAGFDVQAAPTGFIRYEGPAASQWLPQGRAMQEVHSLMREWLALLYYTKNRKPLGGG